MFSFDFVSAAYKSMSLELRSSAENEICEKTGIARNRNAITMSIPRIAGQMDKARKYLIIVCLFPF